MEKSHFWGDWWFFMWFLVILLVGTGEPPPYCNKNTLGKIESKFGIGKPPLLSWDKRPNFSNASIWRLPLELMQLLSFTFTLFIFIFLCFSNHLFSQKWHMFENIYPMSKARMLLSKNLPQPTKKFTRIYPPYPRQYTNLHGLDMLPCGTKNS